ncbi:MAG: preprotein translocase subunit SecG [Deltaproteobacteria bacterium HGW-Deltaproteobacteria-4]|nr:MAG: preprotein translocase subunit SecG [Deltaproteobacteria bacterium HGW-Deltaproteobacteria-4]
METLLLTLHVLVCISLIIIVLLQAGKGAEVGATFGAGSSQTVFGASGGRDFMTKLTTAAAIIFMLTSLTLAYFMDQPATGSIMPSTVTAPATAPTLPTLPPAQGDAK